MTLHSATNSIKGYICSALHLCPSQTHTHTAFCHHHLLHFSYSTVCDTTVWMMFLVAFGIQ